MNMKYKQDTYYQNINGIGPRECNERWDVIKKYIKYEPTSTSIDVGSAEGFFVKNMVRETGGVVISIEGSKFVYDIQKKYCEDESELGKVKLHNVDLTNDFLYQMNLSNIDYCLLLSVLHWLEYPDYILKNLSNISNKVFIELPDLEDTRCYNRKYLDYIKDKYNNIDNYLTSITGKSIIGKHKVNAHTSKYRLIYVLS